MPLRVSAVSVHQEAFADDIPPIEQSTFRIAEMGEGIDVVTLAGDHDLVVGFHDRNVLNPRGDVAVRLKQFEPTGRSRPLLRPHQSHHSNDRFSWLFTGTRMVTRPKSTFFHAEELRNTPFPPGPPVTCTSSPRRRPGREPGVCVETMVPESSLKPYSRMSVTVPEVVNIA
jgi:hypothetical protein